MIKAVIADDIQILRQGLKAILEQDDGIEVAGLAADGREAWQLCRKNMKMSERQPGRMKAESRST